MVGAHNTFILGPIFAHGGRVISVSESGAVLCPSYPMVKKSRMTALIAVHDLNLASNHSYMIIMMKNGKIVAVGDPASGSHCRKHRVCLQLRGRR